MSPKPVIAILGAALMLAGCGLREPLRPAEGQSMPVAPALAPRALTSDEMLAVSSEMRPLRVDEPLTRSEERPADRFDLPPPDVGGLVESNTSELEEEPGEADQPE
ncbi:hypothetical protein [Sphingosinicella sp. YJ22]|uniref:hypothetical protein n=1 Tax=Sphingosinicella sp. YJ22 TaxID=1104780 RepID=UPI001A9CA118|nr:hypothetical protein [Sphingosinicella sp. YJ22]